MASKAAYHGEEERYLTQLRGTPKTGRARAARERRACQHAPRHDTIVEDEPLVKIEDGRPVITG